MSTGKRMDALVEILMILAELDTDDAIHIVMALDQMNSHGIIRVMMKKNAVDPVGAAAVALVRKR